MFYAYGFLSFKVPYNIKVTSFLKKFGCRYNDRLKLWSFDFSRYGELVRTLQSDEFFETHHVVELPRFLLKGLKIFLAKLLPISEQPEPDLSTYMMDTLLPFQLEGLRFVIARRGRAMIADEMVRLFRFSSVDFTFTCLHMLPLRDVGRPFLPSA